MNPDVSLSLPDEAKAERAADVLRGLYVHPGKPLFEVDRRGRAGLPRAADAEAATRRNAAADPPHHADGLRGAFRPTRARASDQRPVDGAARRARIPACLFRRPELEMVRPEIPVTDIAPTILSWFGIGPQPG